MRERMYITSSRVAPQEKYKLLSLQKMQGTGAFYILCPMCTGRTPSLAKGKEKKK